MRLTSTIRSVCRFLRPIGTGVQVAMNEIFTDMVQPGCMETLLGMAFLGQASTRTQLHSYSSRWYYRDYGWIAFGHDWVDYTYTKWVKNNPEHFGVAVGGWEPETVAIETSGTIAMVSGFPTLVMEGEVYTCSSPTARLIVFRSQRHARATSSIRCGADG